MILRTLAFTFLAAAALSAAAQSVCSSDRQPQPAAVLERFINADCETCWQDKATPAAGRRELAIDWVLPGGKGEDAALSTVARIDALARLEALGRKPPLVSDTVRTQLPPPGARLRIAQGVAFNDYIAASIELGPVRGGRRDAWLLLVESLPAGTEGSPVPRNLVRNVFRAEVDSRKLFETRAMQIHEGVKAQRLRLIAVVHDENGRMVAAVQNACR